MKKIHHYIILTLTLFSIGCTSWIALQGGSLVMKDPGFKANMPAGWMGFKPAYGFMATKDGHTLNHISVKKIKFLQRLANTKKRFQEGMLLHEILEIELDSIKSNKGIYYFTILNNTPMTIDGVDAYRIEYEYQQKNGLKIKAVQCGFIYKNFIYRIVFKAAKIHYYEDSIEDFENFLNTFTLLKE